MADAAPIKIILARTSSQMTGGGVFDLGSVHNGMSAGRFPPSFRGHDDPVP